VAGRLEVKAGRMVRQAGTESRRYRVAGRLEVKAGRMVRQAGTKSRNRQGSKPGGPAKRE
jgi:hypothetical protein